MTTAPLITKNQLQDLYMAAAAQPFICEDPLDPDFPYNGMTCAEVMVRKQILKAAQTGDAEMVMDRLLGRPKQSVESTKLSLTYEDFLKETARKEADKRPSPATIAEPVPWQ